MCWLLYDDSSSWDVVCGRHGGGCQSLGWGSLHFGSELKSQAWSISCVPRQKAPKSFTLERVEHLSQAFCTELRDHCLLTLHSTSPPVVPLAGRSVPRQEKLLVPMVSPPCSPPHPFKFNWTCTAKPPPLSRHRLHFWSLQPPSSDSGEQTLSSDPAEVWGGIWKLSPPAKPCSRYNSNGLGI